MNRGEVWTLRDEGYASKARPVVIVQEETEHEFNSVILCLLTTFDSSNIPTRVKIIASDTNGLKKDSFVMTEKPIAVAKNELGAYIGNLADEEMHAISGGLAKVLGIRKEDVS
jgi:mRNA interferase MazF